MRLAFAGIGLAVMGLAFTAPEAQARFGPGVSVPNQVEQVACRIVRQRVVRPNGRVVFVNRRICHPGVVTAPRRAVVAPRARCRIVRERVVTPGGRAVMRDVRRCY
jgi:hypothetical protein